MFLSSGCTCNCTDFFLVQWIADILGIIMNGLYELLSKLGIVNVGLCIILFTIIIKLLMLPMAIKQQKFTRLSSLINPEVQAIQNKYRGKSDQESMIRMREETNAVYEKYGVSPSGSCLQLLIQMPILFALYAVISSIPTYVGDVQDMYMNVSEVAYESIDEYRELSRLNKIVGKEDKNFYNLVDKYYVNDEKDAAVKAIYDQFISITTASTTEFDSMYEAAETIVADIKNVDNWDELIKANEDDKKLLEEYKDKSDEELDNMLEELKTNRKNIDVALEPVDEVYEFVGINLTKAPSVEMSSGVWWALLIPILSALSQWASMKMSQSGNKSSDMSDNPMMQSMNTTMMLMPLMSAFFCYTLPAGMGLYWVIGSLFQIVQQIFLNSYFKNKDVNDIITSNIEKENKKRAARGLPELKITEVANTNVKNIKYEEKPIQNVEKKAVTTGEPQKKMGIADKANMVKKYNDSKNK